MVRETEREIAEEASGYEETDLWDMNAMLVEKLNEKLRINIDPKLSEAKERKWQETIDE